MRLFLLALLAPIFSLALLPPQLRAEPAPQVTARGDFSVPPDGPPIRFSFYNENIYLAQSEHTVSDLNALVLLPITERLDLYLGFHFARDWDEQLDLSFASSYFAPTVGFRFGVLSHLNLWAEYRYLIHDNDGPILRPETEDDGRVGLTYYDEFFITRLAKDWTFTDEVYAESFWMPRIADNAVVNAVWSKLLFNYSLIAGRLVISPYGEFYLVESNNLELGGDSAELRAGLRLDVRASDNVSVKLLAHRGTNIFGSNELLNPTQVLLVIGGQL